MSEAALLDAVAEVRRLGALMAMRLPVVAPTRRYTVEELGYRIVLGTDPLVVSEAQRAAAMPTSRKTVDRLIGAPSGLGADIVAERIAGRWYATEAAVQDWEERSRHLAECRAAGRTNGRTAIKQRRPATKSGEATRARRTRATEQAPAVESAPAKQAP